jgi:hypothetical protein
VHPINCEEILRDRKNKPTKLRLDVTYRGETLQSKYHSLNDYSVTFPETFTFAAPPELPLDDKEDVLRISLYEQGFNLKQRLQKQKNCCARSCSCLCRSWWSFAEGIIDFLFPALWWKNCPCATKHETVSGAVATAAVTAANVTTGILGSATLLADSEEKKLSDVSIVQDEATECGLQLRFGDWRKMKKDLLAGEQPRMDVVVGEAISMLVRVKLQWMPPGCDVDTDVISKIRVGVPSKDAADLHVRHAKVKETPYESVSGVQLMKNEYMPPFRKLLEEVYEADPLQPRVLSSDEAPPVDRVKAVYGIGLPTEISAVYRRRNIVQQKDRIMSLHELDPLARIESKDFRIEDGLILEMPQTPQILFGSDNKKVVRRCGDGTVPYYSLQQCRRWGDECDVQVHELVEAEHREVLADERFLKILLDYVTEY